jgi:hypothetical protein
VEVTTPEDLGVNGRIMLEILVSCGLGSSGSG